MVAKIERAEAIENLAEIVDASDVVMVARGDLGVEIGDAALPGLQKKIIRESIHRRTEVSRAIGKTRLTSGGTKLVHTREVAIINQFREEFGTEGVQIAKALLQLGRGRLG